MFYEFYRGAAAICKFLMHFNRGDIAVVSLSGAVEESDRIQVFTAEKI